jgi:hypothetical protein
MVEPRPSSAVPALIPCARPLSLRRVIFNNGDLDYCIVRPGGLKTGPPTGIVTAGKDQEAGAIARADVAAFCLDAVLEPDFKFNKQAVSISSNMGSGFQSVLSDKTKSRMGK